MSANLLPTATPARTRAVVREMVRPHRKLAVTAFVVILAGTAVGLATAPLLGRIVDIVVSRSPVGDITLPVILLGLTAVGQGALTGLGTNLVARVGERVLARLRERFIDRALRLPLEQVERAGSGDLTSRVTDDVTVIAEAVRDALPALARASLTIALTLGGIAVLDWRFLLAALLAVPIQAHTVRWYAGTAAPLYARQRVTVGVLSHQLLDTIGAGQTVRAFRIANEHLGRVGRKSQGAIDIALRAARLWTRFYGRLNLAEFVGLGAVLTTGFLLVRSGDVSVGTATAAALYFHGLFNPINVALALVDDAQAAMASLARLVGVAETPPPAEPAEPATPADASVAVTDVRHAYRAGEEVLHGVDLDLRPGERVALVGASGAGKTTLAKLIAGIHAPASGDIRVGGAHLDDLGPTATRQAVVLVTQEVHVFAGPLADDLRLAKADATDDELADALEKVGALTWVRALPDGLATVVGEGGHRLTTAQSQQLALARLVLADPPIVILDEATAEAGSAGARLLEGASVAALHGRSALVVAHRLTQAASADRIVVLDAGRVVESGTHDELVTAGGHYATLWEAWSANRASVK
ncbi:ABC transporter ATP-binding protein [Actinophytocola oryzae]|uniref:ATP-binding cassette subfamily C protein n=1 Tax=Actinophytocola oryzae TaxID=502181 RepID=A0A4R7UZ73_9PSEU|nr:ABC transporter ATP-binding protein [Actinophytocola oryzae]TDV42233.1 ATP-binding cassette subfamily C protein [Actinophytocola oryzae]